MAAPFFDLIRGTTSGTPGSGAFTPSAAASGFRAWSVVPTGWIGLVLFEDGSDRELSYSYWNGTTLSRGANAFVWSTTGSQLSLTSAATASMTIPADEIQPHFGGPHMAAWSAQPNSATLTNIGFVGASITGTGAGVALAATNYLTEQARLQSTSATTANAQAAISTAQIGGIASTAAGRGGWEMVTRFGASQLPTGPRLLCGMTTVTYVAVAAEPSALTSAHMAGFCKDSGDTNIQFMSKDGTTAGKTDTGIALAANGWYEASVWMLPGSNTVYGLLIRLDTGAIWYGSRSSNVPANGSLLFPQIVGGLSATTGTAFILQFGSMTLRTGS